MVGRQQQGGGAGGSVLLQVGVLRGGAGAFVSAVGGTSSLNTYTYHGGSSYRYHHGSGGGGGRVALYCTSSEHASSWRGFAGLPELRVWGGGVRSDAPAGKRGGSGTAYVECAGATRGLFLQGASTFDSERRLTELVDDGVTLYDFSHVGLYEGAVLGFAPANVPSVETTPSVSVGVGHFVGDQTGRLT